MLVEEHTYIPLFGRWCEVCMFVEEHTYIPAFGGWCQVPPFGGSCEVCLLGTYIHTSVWALVSGMYVPLLGSLCVAGMEGCF